MVHESTRWEAIDLGPGAATIRSPALLDPLVGYIASESMRAAHYHVVIGGPGAVGKSELARLLSERLADSTYLALDGAVLAAELRDARNLDGYQLAAYDLDLVRQWMLALERGETFAIPRFDKGARRHVGQVVVHGQARVRIIDWIYGLQPGTGVRADLRVVLDGDDRARSSFMYDRFMEQRNHPMDQETLARMLKRVASIEREIAPTLRAYDLRVMIDHERRMTQLRCNRPVLTEALRRGLMPADAPSPPQLERLVPAGEPEGDR